MLSSDTAYHLLGHHCVPGVGQWLSWEIPIILAVAKRQSQAWALSAHEMHCMLTIDFIEATLLALEILLAFNTNV